MVTVNCSHLICASVDDAGRYKSNSNATTSHSSSYGLCFITANAQSTHRSAPVHLQTCFSSLPLVTEHTKNEVRTRAHIRRAGGSTLSGVRNNSFWPSPACALKWSPWVAAYQRAAAIEWVVDITQPGFRTYTGHSKGRAHWAREIHGEADCARSCFDWDWMITTPPPPPTTLSVLWWHSECLHPAEHAFMQRRRWSLQSVMNIKLYVMSKKLLSQYSSDNKCYRADL